MKRAVTTSDPPEQLLTTSEAMAYLRVQRATLCGWARAGQVPHLRLPDGSYRFRLADLEECFKASAA